MVVVLGWRLGRHCSIDHNEAYGYSSMFPPKSGRCENPQVETQDAAKDKKVNHRSSLDDCTLSTDRYQTGLSRNRSGILTPRTDKATCIVGFRNRMGMMKHSSHSQSEPNRSFRRLAAGEAPCTCRVSSEALTRYGVGAYDGFGKVAPQPTSEDGRGCNCQSHEI